MGGGSQLSCTAVELVMSTVTLRTPSDGAAEPKSIQVYKIIIIFTRGM